MLPVVLLSFFILWPTEVACWLGGRVIPIWPDCILQYTASKAIICMNFCLRDPEDNNLCLNSANQIVFMAASDTNRLTDPSVLHLEALDLNTFYMEVIQEWPEAPLVPIVIVPGFWSDLFATVPAVEQFQLNRADRIYLVFQWALAVRLIMRYAWQI